MRPSSATALGPSPQFAARLRAARGKAGLSQREVAERIPIGVGAYLNWENAKTGITWENLRRVADVLDVSEDTLVMGDALNGVPAAPLAADPFVAETLQEILGRLERLEAAIDELRSPSVEGLTPVQLQALAEMAQATQQLEELAEADEHSRTGTTRRGKRPRPARPPGG